MHREELGFNVTPRNMAWKGICRSNASASSKLELDLNSQLSRAKQSYPVISKKFLSVRPSVRPFVMHKNQT
eukprot:scaffold15648_cov135-Skeletonema_menzelii.AAC.1